MRDSKKTNSKAPKMGKVASPALKSSNSKVKGPVKGSKNSGNGGTNVSAKSLGKSSAKQPQPANKGGSYMAFNSGRLSRTYGKYSPMESIDTTGFGKGKKEFLFTKSYSGAKPIVSKVKRQDVPGVISKLKSGATRFLDYRSPSKKGKK